MIILADTGFFLAITLSNDEFHKQAQEFLRELESFSAKSEFPITVATTAHVLTEVFHILRRIDIQDKRGQPLEGGKLGEARRKILSEFWNAINAIEIQIFSSDDELANCQSFIDWNTESNNSILDYADYQLFKIALQKEADAIISADVSDMTKIKNKLRKNMSPLLLLLPQEKFGLEMQSFFEDNITRQQIEKIEAKNRSKTT